MGIEPTPSAWKAEVLPLNYTRILKTQKVVEGEGFEPSKAEPSDLQSDPFDRSGTPPNQIILSLSARSGLASIFFFCSTNRRRVKLAHDLAESPLQQSRQQ
jgi:hypothetical protein